MGWLVAAVQGAHLASLLPAAWRFRGALRDPARAQGERLRAILRANGRTAYGARHRFHEVATLADYQRLVPVADYEALAPWIARAAGGEGRVLTEERPIAFERTGGSTSGDKLVPLTRGFLAELAAATAPWISTLHLARPRLAGTRAYWSVSPAAREHERTAGGLPIGLEDDTEYFGPLARWGLRKTMAVPGSVARLRDIERWRRETIRGLLAARDLGLISIWNPSFLTILMEAIEAALDELLDELLVPDRAAVRARLDREGRLTGEALWPRLALISCWTDAGAAAFLPALRAFFPRTEIQPKGLLATEGVVSVPFAHHGACLAVASHFLELIDLDHPSRAPLPIEAARQGGAYTPLLTTGGGLYRYALRDVVRVTGLAGATPVVRFEGKLDGTSDLCGEKLTEAHVAAALARATDDLRLRFALVAPVMGTPPRYELYLESDADQRTLEHVRDALEADLAKTHHYAYCRDLGQLGALSVVRVKDGARRYQEALAERGARVGSIKPLCLDRRPIWRSVFEVAA